MNTDMPIMERSQSETGSLEARLTGYLGSLWHLPISVKTQGHPLAWLVCLAGVALLGSELAITQLAHGLVARRIGWPYLLIHPLTLIVVGAALLGMQEKRLPLPSSRGLVTCALVLAASVVVSTALNDAQWEPTLRYLWFGVVGIVAMALAAERLGVRLCMLVLVAGLSTWAIVGVAVYTHSWLYLKWTFPPTAEYSWDQMVIAMRMPGETILKQLWHDEFIGNMNKASNYALLGVVLLGYLIVCGLRISVALLLYLPLALLLVLTFSRGAFVVGALTALVIWVARLRLVEGRINGRHVHLAAAMLLLPTVTSVTAPAFRAEWSDFTTVFERFEILAATKERLLGRSAGDPASVESAFPKGAASSPEANLSIISALVGAGGDFSGLSAGGLERASTHNLFADTWFKGGLPALLALIGIFAVACHRPLAALLRATLTPEGLFGTVGVCAIFALGLREYELAYLGATSMGASLLAAFGSLGLFQLNASGPRAPR